MLGVKVGWAHSLKSPLWWPSGEQPVRLELPPPYPITPPLSSNSPPTAGSKASALTLTKPFFSQPRAFPLELP